MLGAILYDDVVIIRFKGGQVGREIRIESVEDFGKIEVLSVGILSTQFLKQLKFLEKNFGESFTSIEDNFEWEAYDVSIGQYQTLWKSKVKVEEARREATLKKDIVGADIRIKEAIEGLNRECSFTIHNCDRDRFIKHFVNEGLMLKPIDQGDTFIISGWDK
jgi:hypothetical protein